MKVVLEIGKPEYYESKAIELIREAQNAVTMYIVPEGKVLQQYQEKMAQAIQLLALARLTREEAQASGKAGG